MTHDTFKTIEEIPKYKNGSKAIPRDEIVIQYSAVKSLVIQVLEQLIEREEKELVGHEVNLAESETDKDQETGFNTAKQDTISHLKSEIEAIKEEPHERK